METILDPGNPDLTILVSAGGEQLKVRTDTVTKLARAPEEMQRVFLTALGSAHRAFKTDDEGFSLAHQAIYLKQGEGDDSRTWSISDNFERFCDLVLVFKDGIGWSTSHMYADHANNTDISLEEALANARLMFSDG